MEQNPHWEIEWLKDREKALARTAKNPSSDSDDTSDKKKKKRKDRHFENLFKDKKKKKRSKKHRKLSSDSSSSTSSSSESSSEDEQKEKGDKSRSIRVAMRNMKVQAIINEDLESKWAMLGRLVEHTQKETTVVPVENQKQDVEEDRLINQWMTVSEPQEKDKRLLDSLKDRMKLKQEAEKIKTAELERQQREREREELELQQKKAKEQQEAYEREEHTKQERQRQEFEHIRDRDREQVRFRTKDKYRKRSTSGSPESKTGAARSPSSDRKRNKHSPVKRKYAENGRPSHERRSDSYDDSSPSRSRRKHESRDSKQSQLPIRKDKKPPPAPGYKRLPFIGRMPLFKNKKNEDKAEKEIKKEDYDIPRQSRFQPGNLARAFIPEPEVVCFPKLSSIPPLSVTGPTQLVYPPEPPKITEPKTPKAPPPPKIGLESKASKLQAANEEKQREEQKHSIYQGVHYQDHNQLVMDSSMMAQYQYDYGMMYQQMYDYSQDIPTDNVPPEISGEMPLSHILPLEPPPLPPDDPNDDLAMLGISADDMAAQMF